MLRRLGCRHRPRYRRTKRSAEWEVAVERPAYDLTIFKLHCGKLTLKIYSKGEPVLRIEAVGHNTRELNCGRSLDRFPEVVSRLRALRERFADALSRIGPRHAAYDLKKLRGKHIVCRIGHTRRYQPLATGLRAMTALVVLRNKVIKPLLAAAQPHYPARGAHNPKPIDLHYDALRRALHGRLPRARHRRLTIDKVFVGLRLEAPSPHSTVTLLARLRGWSTSVPLLTAAW
jgi:hypothetical protein